MTDLIEVQLNGQTREVPRALSVRRLLEHLELRPEVIVVERNRQILDRGHYDHVTVTAGDEIELVHFVGGG